MMNKSVFVLFANCVTVRGANRSTICDLQRGNIHLIPNALFDMLNEYKNYSLEEIYLEYGIENKLFIDEYYQFLVETELGFFCPLDQRQNFPSIDFVYETPHKITNVIIDIETHLHDFNSIFTQLENLGCISLQLRFFSDIDYEYLKEILILTRFRRIKSIEVIVKYNSWTTVDNIKNLFRSFLSIINFTVHSSPYVKKVDDSTGLVTNFNYIKDVINDATHCGFVDTSLFASNIEAFSEALSFNSCLNKKLSIDIQGNIKNCPAMNTSYGNIISTSLEEVVNSQVFNEKMKITKDTVSICQDCEFRYVCTDCRALLLDPLNSLSKPLRCSYNPYISKWE